MPRAGETPSKDPFDRLLAIRRLARNNPNEHEAKAAEVKLAKDLEKAGLTERDLDRISAMRGEKLHQRPAPKPVPRPVPEPLQPHIDFVFFQGGTFFTGDYGYGYGYTGTSNTSTANVTGL